MRKHASRYSPFVICAVLLVSAIGGQAQAQDMSLEEARAMVRVAREAYDRGDYAEALRIARKVLEERGDVVAHWPGPGAKHPAPEADIYNRREFIRAQNLAAQETGAEVIIRVDGSSPRKIIFHALYKMGDWEATAQMAEEILAQNPDADVARSILKVARAKMAEAKQAQAPLVTYPEGRSLYVVGEAVQTEGQLWVKLRGIEQLPGASVTWDQATGSATMSVGNHTFTVWPGRQDVLVDDALRPLTAAPYLDKDRLMVPVHFLAKALDREVKWEAESQLLHIVPKIAWVR